MKITDLKVFFSKIYYKETVLAYKCMKTSFHHSSGCAKTYVRLSGTGRNLVRTWKPLTWFVRGTSTFLIFNRQKKNRNSWKLTSNYNRIKIYLIVINKANLILDKIMLNIPFNFAMPRPFYLFSHAPFGLGIWQNVFDKNSWVLDNQI